DGDVAALVDAADRVLTDDGWRRELVERGLARARLLSWDRAAAAHAEVFRAAAGS
ncbi:MAG: glycosyltransferase family 1 protein, partial [Actinobacteria bacterium]|nr:glycosyltransferase family 1 protein [Actinomycetota bacterium]